MADAVLLVRRDMCMPPEMKQRQPTGRIESQNTAAFASSRMLKRADMTYAIPEAREKRGQLLQVGN